MKNTTPTTPAPASAYGLTPEQVTTERVTADDKRNGALCTRPGCVEAVAKKIRNGAKKPGKVFEKNGVAGVKHGRGSAPDRANRKAILIERYGDCTYCRVDLRNGGLEQDRIIESCRYVIANVVPACKACNNARNRKNAPTPDAAAIARIAEVIAEHPEFHA